MLASKEKISIRQAMLILIVIVNSPAVRGIPSYVAEHAKQAGWLSPLIALVVFIPFNFIFHSIYKKYKEASFAEIMEDIFEKKVGKITTSFFIIGLTLTLIINIRNYSDKLVSTIYPNTNILIFIAIMLFIVALIVRKGGIVVLARMSEIIAIIILPTILIVFVLLLKDIKIDNLTPISYLDFFPALKSSISIMGILAHLPFILLFSNYINDKEKIKKAFMQTVILVILLIMILLVLTIGTLGASTIEILPIPATSTVKQISVLERVESVVSSLWILSDFMVISIVLFTILNMYRSLFKFADTKPLINIYLVIVYFLAVIMARNEFEFRFFVGTIIFPVNIFLGFFIPVLVFIVGKIRRKI